MTRNPIRHPGPSVGPRWEAVEVSASPAEIVVNTASDFQTELFTALDHASIEGAVFFAETAPCKAICFVMPAAAPDTKHAAWYSETQLMTASPTIKTAVILVGYENGKRFIHCHGRWHETAGNDRIGHLLADQTHLSAPTTLHGWAIAGGSFDRTPDTETNFNLFKPVATRPAADPNGLLLRIAPNQDLTTTIETACMRYGIERGSIHGLGSIVGARFTDGSAMTSYATELMIDEGRIENGQASLDISIVGLDGNHMQGRLLNGKNAVCVTAELFIQRQD